nr:hypothetical protein [Tanacetum cinerariifolium]
VGTVVAQCAGDGLGHAHAVGGVDQVAEAAARRGADEVVGRVAGDAFDGVADEQHRMLALQQAAVGDAGDVADQRTELLLA